MNKFCMTLVCFSLLLFANGCNSINKILMPKCDSNEVINYFKKSPFEFGIQHLFTTQFHIKEILDIKEVSSNKGSRICKAKLKVEEDPNTIITVRYKIFSDGFLKYKISILGVEDIHRSNTD